MSSPAAATPAPQPAAAAPAGWTVNSSAKGGFSIAYPQTLHGEETDTTDSSWRLGDAAQGMQYFTLTVPDSFELKTNLGIARITVGASPAKSALEYCLTPDNTDAPKPVPPKQVTINGTQFTIFESEDNGTGTVYDTTSYRTLTKGQCYAVEYFISHANLANYDPSLHIRAFDQAKVESLLRSIVATFKFQ
jgi:hypothetical protein